MPGWLVRAESQLVDSSRRLFTRWTAKRRRKRMEANADWLSRAAFELGRMAGVRESVEQRLLMDETLLDLWGSHQRIVKLIASLRELTPNFDALLAEEAATDGFMVVGSSAETPQVHANDTAGFKVESKYVKPKSKRGFSSSMPPKEASRRRREILSVGLNPDHTAIEAMAVWMPEPKELSRLVREFARRRAGFGLELREMQGWAQHNRWVGVHQDALAIRTCQAALAHFDNARDFFVTSHGKNLSGSTTVSGSSTTPVAAHSTAQKRGQVSGL